MHDNAPRLKEGAPHVESWFIRANHPLEPRAIWLKGTLLSRARGAAVAEAWCAVFDGDRTFGVKTTVPLPQARVEASPLVLEVADCRIALDASAGSARGSLRNARGNVRWDVTLRPVDGPLGAPLCMLPTRSLIDGPLPKNKLLTPAPAVRMGGTLEWDGTRWDLEGWTGMQGHNWGPAHAPKYAWGQCLFLGADGAPFCMVEAASGKIRLGSLTTPLLSLMVVRRGDREYRFDRIVDLWRQDPRIAFPEWSLRMRGRCGEAQLVMRAQPERMVCLGYENPDGRLSYCLNSKTSEVRLRVNPVNEDPFECFSPVGGALEFLEQAADPRVQPVV